jgi:4-hydroxybenzoate polyprenyltransferase
VLYDARAKRHAIAGPVNMGLCRGLNLLRGVAAVPVAVAESWPIALISLVYIAAVTTVSRGEVHGGKAGAAAFALISLSGVLAALTVIGFGASAGRGGAISALALTALLGYRVMPPFWRARADPRPPVIGRAVKTGVLSLVLVDAVISAAYGGPLYTVAVLATALVADSLARLFSVT